MTAPQSRTRSRVAPRPVTDFATELPAFADPGLEALLIRAGSSLPIEGSSWVDADALSSAPIAGGWQRHGILRVTPGLIAR